MDNSENSMRFGLMAVFAVSGSMAFLVHHVHKRILSNFMKKFEFEVNGISYPQKNFHGTEQHHHHHNHNHAKKRVRFAKELSEVTMEKKVNRRNMAKMRGEMGNSCGGTKLEDMMPLNRAVLYKGILKYRNLTPSGRLGF